MAEVITDYGIKYHVIRVQDDLYFLIPYGLVEGYATSTIFYNEHEYPVLSSIDSLSSKTIVDSILSETSLKEIYNYDDISFLKEYFLSEESEKILIISTKNKKMRKIKIDINLFAENNFVEVFEILKDEPIVSLNEASLEAILSSDDINDIHAKMLKYKSLIHTMRTRERKDGTTKITVKNGSIAAVETKRKVASTPIIETASTSAEHSSILGSDISLTGLEKYIKERVFGHDREIRKLSKSILMNYTAEAGEKNEPILLLGPTGTGKTETMHAVSSYLDVPLLEVNSVNLVPQGIKGMSLEDCLYSLIVSCNYNQAKAERSIIFFDEFDKLGRVSSDYKSPVTQILLKFIEGGNFLIDKPNDDYNFNTRMLVKIFAGAFSELFEEEKRPIGFTDTRTNHQTFKPQNITEKEYFGKELITRIPHILVFNELTREDKKRVIISSKISEYLIKKQRYARQFGVSLEADDSYIEALLERLEIEQKSMRDLNNLIVESLDEAEYEMLSQPSTYKRLTLTRDTVEDNRKFTLD